MHISHIFASEMSSCEPPHWETNKRRNATLSEITPRKQKKARAINSNQEGLQHITNVVSNHIRQGTNVETSDCDISSLLDTVPFVKMLADVNVDVDGPPVPLVSRVYEENFMRQCISDSETPCVMQAQCECMVIDPSQPFVGTAFIIPSETSTNNGMCLLCLRKTTQMLFYKTIHSGHPVNAVIQKYGNICNEPGEYHASAMLICPPNGPIHSMPIPIVGHQRNKYSVVNKAGILWIQQHNVQYEDFT